MPNDSWMCEYPGCDKAAQDARTKRCVRHGGGARCEHPSGCNRLQQGRTKLCIAHGGGKRCTQEGCDKSALAGPAQRCATHGGGKRCGHPEGCEKASGATNFKDIHGVDFGNQSLRGGFAESIKGELGTTLRHPGF